MTGPTKSETIKRPSSGVIHFRYAVDPLRPWQGLGPLQSASATGTLAGALEQRLGEESGAPSALLLPIPADGGDGGEGDPLANLKTDIAKAKGRPVVLKTTSGGFGEGPGNAPQRDWQQSRIGANPPEVLVNLRKESTLSVMSACQVPISLITDADGTSQREAWRRFVMGAVEPLSQRMAEELSRKLDLPSLDFKFRSLWASDLIGRTQAFQRLVQGGMGISGSGIRCRDHGRMTKYGTQITQGAYADIKDAGAEISFKKKSTTIVSGVALQIKGDPEEYEALKLIEKAALTLLFVSETYGDSPPLGSFCEWGGSEISSGSHPEACTGWNSRPESSHC